MLIFTQILVPSPVGSLSSLMYTTWANISWTVPSYIPVSYPIITYEIGYNVLDSCSYVDINSQLIILSNISNVSTSTSIIDLRANTCYLFGVRAYTINGYGLWSVIVSRTSVEPTEINGKVKFIVVFVNGYLIIRCYCCWCTWWCYFSYNTNNSGCIYSYCFKKVQ